MKCERCGTEGTVERYAVDGFVGHLCTGCREAWDHLRERETAT